MLERLFRNIFIAALDLLPWLMNKCGDKMMPYFCEALLMKGHERFRCIVFDVSAKADFVAVLGPEIVVLWKKNGSKMA